MLFNKQLLVSVSNLLMFLVAYVAYFIDIDQTAPLRLYRFQNLDISAFYYNTVELSHAFEQFIIHICNQ